MLALLILFATGLFLFYKFQSSSSSKAPPGPTPFPIIGNLPQLSRAGPTPYQALETLSKTYGDVMSVRLGVHKLVILSSYTAIKDLIPRPELDGRYVWPFATDRSFHKELGVVFTSQKFWNDTRKTTIKNMRDFGFGKKSSMEIVIREEVSDLLSYIRAGLEKTDGVLSVLHNFDLSVVNVLWSLVAGFRFSYDDPISNQMMRYNDKINEAFNFNNIYLPFPILRKIFPKLTGWDKHMEYYTGVQDFMRELIYKIRDQMKLNNNAEGGEVYQPQNFVEVYLMEIEKNQGNTSADNIYTEENLIMILLDLFLAGSETTNSVLRFSLLYMLHFPQVQDRVRQEINAMSPSGEMLSIHDLHKMPYTKATLYEVFRYSNMVPVPLAHRALKDIEYRGMIIKKDTCVMYNQTCNFFDESHFKDARTFNPERFLSEDGTQVINTERVTPFGIKGSGRICLGETLAWNSFFIYFTTFLQNYKLQPVPGAESNVDDVVVSFSLSPKEFKVKMVPV